MMDGSKGFEDAQTGEQQIRNFNINFGPQHPARTACCVWFWNWMVKLSNAATRTLDCCTAVPKS